MPENEKNFIARDEEVIKDPYSVAAKFTSRIKRKAWLKAGLIALSFAALVGIAIAIVAYYFGGAYFWVGIIASLVAAAVLTPIFYRWKFRPSELEIAREIDSVGLEERMITMHELKNEQTIIAVKQREDALKTLSKVSERVLKDRVPRLFVIIACVALTLFAGTNVLSALAYSGVIKRGDQVIEDIIRPDPIYFEVSYEIDGEGIIDGNIFQLVEQGKDAEEVCAYAFEDWVFAGWSEKGQPWSPLTSAKNSKDVPFRIEKNVNESVTYIAHFVKVENGADFDPDAGEGEADDADDKPPKFGNGEEQSQQQGETEEGDPKGGGRYVPHNQIYNGETYYGGDTYRGAYEETVESLEEDDEMPDERKRLVLDYYDVIEK
ncbi:MAG: magnesium transporter [Clostridia bacterium]|nr:magnesium transporter [Clostridia bacterium]